MKLGAENRNKTIAAAVLAAIAAVLVIRGFVGGAAPAPATPSPASNAQPANARRNARGPQSALLSPLDPRLRLDLLKTAENNEYKGSGRDIFRAEAAPPKIPAPITPPFNPNKPEPSTPPPNPGPPPPPPINLKFFGFASRPGEPTRVFLSADNQVFVASQGDIVKGRYKILRITPVNVEVQDVLNNNKQTIPLTQG